MLHHRLVLSVDVDLLTVQDLQPWQLLEHGCLVLWMTTQGVRVLLSGIQVLEKQCMQCSGNPAMCCSFLPLADAVAA